MEHSNILKFIGASLNPPNLCVITEFMPNGDLHTLLRKFPDLHWKTKLQFALDTAKGMEYLHSIEFVHRDLKGLNLLVDENFTVKVADFGLCRVLPETLTSQVASKVGTLNW